MEPIDSRFRPRSVASGLRPGRCYVDDHQELLRLARALESHIVAAVEPSRQQSLALTKLQETVMWSIHAFWGQ